MIRRGRKEKAIILFTRVPEPGRTKTRMMPRYTGAECSEMQTCFLRDIMAELRRCSADVFVCYEPSGDLSRLRRICGRRPEYFAQSGEGLGERMLNAFREVFAKGYRSCVLLGSDIPEMTAGDIKSAFDVLDHSDAVCGPTADGGYCLIGMKRPLPELFDGKSYGHEKVIDDLMAAADSSGIRMGKVRSHRDMDTPDDLLEYLAEMRSDAHLRRSHTGRFVRDHLRISVIIPVYNESSTIDCMISQLEDIKDDCEIIFVDGGSTDDTLSRIPEGYRIIKSRKGRGAQMNAGASAGSGNIHFFLHCDSELPEDPLGEIRRVMTRREAGCFGIAFHSRQFFMWTNRWISNGRARIHGIMFGDQGMFMTRELFERLGGFREIPVMEDYQFSLDIRRLGIKPGLARHRIYTSDRRYPKATIPKLRLMHQMYRLRREYKAGTSAEEISRKYRDIR